MLRIGPGDDATRWEHIALWGQQLRAGERPQVRITTPEPSGAPAVASGEAALEDGLSLSEALRARESGPGPVRRDMQEGIALLEVVDAVLTDSVALLDRIRVLTAEGADEAYSEEHRRAIQTAVDYSVGEFAAVGERTAYNGRTFHDLADEAPPALRREGLDPGDEAGRLDGASAEPDREVRPERLPVVTGLSVLFSGGRAGVSVESWTGEPVGGIYTLSKGEVRDGLGRSVGTYGGDARTVTFAGGASVTFTGPAAPSTRAGRTTFTLTPVVEWVEAEPSGSPEEDAVAEDPAPTTAPAPVAAETDDAEEAIDRRGLSVMTPEESAVSASRTQEALGRLTRLRVDMATAAQAVLHQDDVAATHETNLASVITRLQRTDIAAEAVAAARYDLVREFGRTLVGLVAVTHREAVDLLTG